MDRMKGLESLSCEDFLRALVPGRSIAEVLAAARQ